jgi:thiol-disulfide isomerase/thioredoxin
MLYNKIYQHLKLAKMNTQKECPICMEIIDFNKNCVTTECGHCFHTNCLMTSVAHNGFGCPYCRTAMAEEIKDEEEEEEEEEEEDEEDDEDMFNDNSLRGFRFFMNNISGEPHEQEDIEDEEEQMENIRERIQDAPPKPSAEFIVDKLLDDDITMEDLVKVLLLEHEEYDDDDEELARIEGTVFGKMRIIISNFRPGEGLPRVNNLLDMLEIANRRESMPIYSWNRNEVTSE